MANYATLKAAVADVVKTNGAQAITGANLQAVLLSIINSIGGGGYIFAGVATTSTNPGTPDENVFYIGGAGLYANFGSSFTVPKGAVGIFKYNGSWTKESVVLGSTGNVSLISSNEMMPNIDSVAGTLDLGVDPVLLIGDTQYNLSVLQQDVSKYRAIPIYNGINTACKLVFNTSSYEFEQLSWNAQLEYNQVLIGGTRVSYINNVYYGLLDANLPFSFTVDAPSPITAEDLLTFRQYILNNTGDNDNRGILNLPIPKRNVASVHVRMASGWSTGFVGVANQYLPITLGAGNYDSGWSAERAKTYTTDVSDTSEFYYIGFSRGTNHTTTFTKSELMDAIVCIRFFYKSFLPVFDETRSKFGKYGSMAKIAAHRGYHLNGVPENSIDAYRIAGTMGYDYCETDICPTADGKLVLMHDDTINRTMYTSSYEPIAEPVAVNSLTLSVLQSNYVLIADDPRMRKPIPTYEEFLQTCRDYDIHPLIELKLTMTQAYILDAYEKAMEILGRGNFTFISFSYEFLDYVRTLDDSVDCYYIGQQSILGTYNSITGESREDVHNIWDPRTYGYGLDEEKVREYHSKGMKVAAWVVSPTTYDEIGKMGVDIFAIDELPPNMNACDGWVFNSDYGWNDFNMRDVTIVDNVVHSNGTTTSLVGYSGKVVKCGGVQLEVTFVGTITLRINGTSYELTNQSMSKYRTSLLVSNYSLTFDFVMADANTMISEIRGKVVEF